MKEKVIELALKYGFTVEYAILKELLQQNGKASGVYEYILIFRK